MPKNILKKPLLAALVLSLDQKGDYPEGCNCHIFPDGKFRSDDGRPASVTSGKLLDWQMNAEAAAALISALEASGKPILYDYEHNSLWGDSRAAGWITRLVYVAGRGLFGLVEWTPAASDAVAKKEYRYSSPCFYFHPETGAVTELISVALTNNPALGDLGAVELARKAALSAISGLPVGQLAQQFLSTSGGWPGTTTTGDQDVFTPEQLAALTAERDGLKTQLAALTGERDGLKTQVAALTTERDGLKNQVAALEKEKQEAALAVEKKEHADLLSAALSEGRLAPAQKGWAEKLSLAALKEFLDASKPIMDATRQGGGGDQGGGHGLSADELAMCSRMGVLPEDYKNAKA